MQSIADNYSWVEIQEPGNKGGAVVKEVLWFTLTNVTARHKMEKSESKCLSANKLPPQVLQTNY